MMNDNRDRQDLEALLPWFAARKLDDATRARVEEALKTDSELRAKLALVEEERDATKKLNESLGDPGEAAWKKIAAVVAAEPRKLSFFSHVAEFVGLGAEPKRRRLAFAGAAALLVIVAETGALVALAPTQGAGRYATATAPAASTGALALIGFAPDARLDELSAFLAARHASIIEGPRGGLYKVRFGDKILSKAEMDALIGDLRAAPLVRFALPAGG
jgi:anti-sigma factor RsiW